MVKLSIIWFSILGIFLLISCAKQDSNREVVDFNFDWSFHLDENSSWEKVRLPHNFCIPFNLNQPKTDNKNISRVTTAWYKKDFTIDKADLEKVIWLEFNSNYKNLEVWLNGNLINKNTNRDKSIRYILSENVVYDKPNEIIVKVENAVNSYKDGYHRLSICPSIQLIKASPIHIESSEIQVTTNGKHDDVAIVNIIAKVQNHQTNTSVKASILDPKGENIFTHELNSSDTFSKQVELPNPQFWELSKPHLYQLILQVYDGNVQVDSITKKFSVRSIKFEAENDFILNGKRYMVKGVNISPDVGIIGSVMTKPSWIYLINKLKTIGVNTISLPSAISTSQIQEYCDELGILLVDRNFKINGLYSEEPDHLKENFLFDQAGFKTPKGHYFECLWNDKPKVFAFTSSTKKSVISSNSISKTEIADQVLRLQNSYTTLNEHWNYKEDEKILIQVYTNCDEVELLINNRSKGRKKLKDFTQDKIIKWLIPFEAGNTIIKGYNEGKHVAGHALFTNNNAFTAKLFSDKDTLKADSYDLAFVELNIYDDAGHKMNGTNLPVKLTISGAGEILAIGNGLINNIRQRKNNKVNTHNGKALVIVRSTGLTGEIIIKGWLEEREVAEKRILVRH